MPDSGSCEWCGHPEKPPVGSDCVACGKINFGVVRLVSLLSGKYIEFKTRARVGQKDLMVIDPEGAKYASECQFELNKDDSLLAWTITEKKAPRHRTFVNGSPLNLGEPMPLKHGDSISIEDRVLKLNVEFH